VESNTTIPEGRVSLRYEFEPTGKPDLAKGMGAPGRAQLYIANKPVGELAGSASGGIRARR
jgi:hypothetical protein